MKLRNKINVSTAFLFIALFIMSNFSIYFIFSHLMIHSEMEQAKAEAEQMVEGISKSLGTISTEGILRAYVPVDGMIQIVTNDQQRLPPVTSLSEQNLSKRAVHYL